MEYILLLGAIVLFDRTLPFNMMRFGEVSKWRSIEETHARYRWISFPRTPLAVAVLGVFMTGRIARLNEMFAFSVELILLISYFSVAVLDVFRAGRK